MAASFKLPCLLKKRKPPVNFPLFEWRDISLKEQLGSGTFGSVYLVNYEKEEQNVIVKKMKGESAEFTGSPSQLRVRVKSESEPRDRVSVFFFNSRKRSLFDSAI